MRLNREKLISKFPAKFFLYIILFFSAVIFLKVVTYNYYPDFSVYYDASRTVLQGKNPYLEGKNYFSPYVYPPTNLLFTLPFALLPFLVSEKLFTVLSLVSLFSSIY